MVVVVLAVAGGLLIARGWDPFASATNVDPAPSATDMPMSSEIEHTYGVRFTNAVLTGGDAIIELRYQVLDAAKATALHDAAAPFVTVGGTTLATPAMGTHGHGSETPAGRAAYVLLTNVGHTARAGAEVTIHVGDLELEHVVLH